MGKFLKIMITFFIVIFIMSVFLLAWFFIGKAPEQKNILWGVDFSQMQTEALKLDWKETYTAILDDLKVKNIKLHIQWDFVEGQRGTYFFNDIDWQISEAEKRNVKIIFVVGLKTGRWPECHEPKWAKDLSILEQKQEILNYIKEAILRYKDSKTILAWQAENEPLFKFGICPDWYYDNGELLKKEVALIKKLDPTRQVYVSDSGEQSMWINSAKIGDKVGTTMYRKVWSHVFDGFGFYFDSYLQPIFYWRKAQIIKWLFGKEVICVELQAEPWAERLFYDVPLKEQEKSMDLQQFKANISFAKKTGLKEFYLWGAEWWYWMKKTQDRPEIWNEAKTLFK
jgi:hypothetical protein